MQIIHIHWASTVCLFPDSTKEFTRFLIAKKCAVYAFIYAALPA